jgi:hypothetical protein
VAETTVREWITGGAGGPGSVVFEATADNPDEPPLAVDLIQ